MRSSPAASALDAITVDAMGTLVELDDPAPRLQRSLAEHGVERELDEVAAAFKAEVAYYIPRTLEGRDEESLADLGQRCTGVFLEHARTDLDPAAFAPAFLARHRLPPPDRSDRSARTTSPGRPRPRVRLELGHLSGRPP